MKEPILCYIKEPWAYFTTQSLQKQWGDDWDDRPYEYNAGPPYSPMVIHYCDERGEVKDPRDWNADGTPKWEIIKIAWDGYFETPCTYLLNSSWSVKDINNKCVPWLITASDPKLKIWAGTKLSKFKKLIRKYGGNVYEIEH